MPRARFPLLALLCGLVLTACVTRSADVLPEPADPADFAGWDCRRLDDELDAVQQRAADRAWAVDERAGNNFVALGLGVAVFPPALLAMRPEGPESKELAQLKGRYDALLMAERSKGCPPPAIDLSPDRAAGLPVALGERLVYEQRLGAVGRPGERALRLVALRRDQIEFRTDPAAGTAGADVWRQDLAGNLVAAPAGELVWPHLLPRGLVSGQAVAGELLLAGDERRLVHAGVRGTVVAVGPQTVAERSFDVAVVELVGDAVREDRSTRLDGVLVVDRASGVLLRLDLRSAQAGFTLQRRLVRIEGR